MVVELGLSELVDNNTLESCNQWVNTENEQEGKYFNFLEAFLWLYGDGEKNGGVSVDVPLQLP